MLDLQRHVDCPIWNDILSDTSTAAAQWSGVKYACQKVLQAYCKVFDQQELYDLIVRYFVLFDFTFISLFPFFPFDVIFLSVSTLIFRSIPVCQFNFSAVVERRRCENSVCSSELKSESNRALK